MISRTMWRVVKMRGLVRTITWEGMIMTESDDYKSESEEERHWRGSHPTQRFHRYYSQYV